MPIDPQRALEGYVRALSYSSHDPGPEHDPGPKHEPAASPAGTPRPASGSGTAEPERSAPTPVPVPAPAVRSGPGILLRLLSLRRAPATAEETRRV
ncbi:hypothetical protein [Streptomyces sp. NPDC017529]|uniref:hypothetical protein n=1 Tax=Streptomyces sp. NPDC017529 TaxID=3365000 RepID=UPI00378B68AC